MKKLLKESGEAFSFYNKHTKIFVVWTILCISLTILFSLAMEGGLPIITLIIVSLVLTLLFTLVSLLYIAKLSKKEKKVLSKIHNILNKSFRISR